MVPITETTYLPSSSTRATSRGRQSTTCWLSHFQQFGSFVTKMSDQDRDVLLIADPKVMQARVDAQPREKALQASAEEKVSLWQLGIRQGAVSEANSEAIDVAAFKAKEDITLALSFMEDARTILDEFNPAEPYHEVRKLHKRLCRAS